MDSFSLKFFLLALFSILSMSSMAQVSLFQEQSELNFAIQAPFHQLLEQKKFLFNTRYASFFPGKIILPDGQEISIQLKVRGKTSLKQCHFPKLEIDVTNKEEAKGTVFEKVSSFKLGTHCENNGRGFQRLGDERAIKREHFAYRIFHFISPYAYQTRLSQITYQDEMTGKKESHSAFILESHKELRKRLGLKQKFGDLQAIFNDGIPSDLHLLREDPTKVDFDQIIKDYLFQILSGNTDFQILKYKYGIRIADNFLGYDPLWNHTGLKFSEDWVSVVPKDFDIAASVLGKENPQLGQDVLSILRVMPFNKDENDPLYQEALRKAIKVFLEMRTSLFDELDKIQMDEEGKKIFSNRLEAFYEVLDSAF